ncbi:hypothetical protein HanHA300_Chr13g0470121 [Helianthus annuus]|nr:hypothetical protein HanHA300_Chr13g0470121 [Helianthus annuus]KAJ0662670.1 hypothetical protein HanLR1_Chr13g0472331 [Helianthus annuus]
MKSAWWYVPCSSKTGRVNLNTLVHKICYIIASNIVPVSCRPSKRVGLGHGSKQVRVKMGQLKRGCFGSGRNYLWIVCVIATACGCRNVERGCRNAAAKRNGHGCRNAAARGFKNEACGYRNARCGCICAEICALSLSLYIHTHTHRL